MKFLKLLLMGIGLAGSAAAAAAPPLRGDVLYFPNTEAGRKAAQEATEHFDGRQEVAVVDFRLGPGRAPRVTQQVSPVYPPDLKQAGREGAVNVAFVIDDKGDVIDVAAIAPSDPDFVPAALEAVRQWKFDPARIGQTNIRIGSRVPLNFRLNATEKSARTAKVVVDARPAAAVTINNIPVGTTPVTVNLEIDDKGRLRKTVSIAWNYALATGIANPSPPKHDSKTWPAGKSLPARISAENGVVVESGSPAPANSPAVKASVPN